MFLEPSGRMYMAAKFLPRRWVKYNRFAQSYSRLGLKSSSPVGALVVTRTASSPTREPRRRLSTEIRVRSHKESIFYGSKKYPFRIYLLSPGSGPGRVIPCAYLVLYPDLAGRMQLDYALKSGRYKAACEQALQPIISSQRAKIVQHQRGFNPRSCSLLRLYPAAFRYKALLDKGGDIFTAFQKTLSSLQTSHPGLSAGSLENILTSRFGRKELVFINTAIRLISKDSSLPGRLNSMVRAHQLDLPSLITLSKRLYKKEKSPENLSLICSGIQTYLKFCYPKLEFRFLATLLKLILTFPKSEEALVSLVKDHQLDLPRLITLSKRLYKKEESPENLSLICSGIQTYLKFCYPKLDL